MKRIELIKSIILALLVVLSVTLTFSIWTYTPNYEMIEQPPPVDILIAEKKEISTIIKPYKLLFNFEEGLTGTIDSEEIDQLLTQLQKWTIFDLTLESHDFDEEKLAAFMRKHNHFTLFFHGDVPLPLYDNIVNVEESSLPEMSFDRIVVDWSSASTTMDLYFINQTNHLRYKAKLRVPDVQSFQRLALAKGKDYEDYEEVDPDSLNFIAVPSNPIELIRNTYYQDETSPTKFRNALFYDPNAVRRNQVGLNLEEFKDDQSLMTIDTARKTLNYVHPAAENKEMAIPSNLLLNTIDFVNEHGGWTDEYRYTYMDPLQRKVKFQLYAHGLPVWSDSTKTEIEQVWGNERIFNYVRPYYTLDLTVPSETGMSPLPSGVAVANMLLNSELLDFSLIEEIIPAYYMKHDEDNPRLFILEPSWYYSINDSWVRFSPEQLGGETIGLE